MNPAMYLFETISLMVCCFLLGALMCFVGMKYASELEDDDDVEESEDDAVDCVM